MIIVSFPIILFNLRVCSAVSVCLFLYFYEYNGNRNMDAAQVSFEIIFGSTKSSKYITYFKMYFKNHMLYEIVDIIIL